MPPSSTTTLPPELSCHSRAHEGSVCVDTPLRQWCQPVGAPVLHHPPGLPLGVEPHHIGVAQHGDWHGFLWVQIMQWDHGPPGLGPTEALCICCVLLGLWRLLLLLCCGAPLRRGCSCRKVAEQQGQGTVVACDQCSNRRAISAQTGKQLPGLSEPHIRRCLCNLHDCVM